MKTIETWLPIFPGFYNTIFQTDESNEIDYRMEEREVNGLNKISPDLIQFDYEGYEEKIGLACCNFIEFSLKEFVSKVEFQRISSPREYNFSNDSIHCIISLSEDNEKSILKFIIDNIEDFKIYLKENYTSCSGFISHYSNDVSEWVLPENLSDKHKLGAILNFICQCNEINEDDMFESCSDCQIEVFNFEEITEQQYCNVCKSFVPVSAYDRNCCKECKERQIKDVDIIICSKCGEEIVNRYEKRHFIHNVKHGLINYTEIICNECNL